MQFSLHTQTFTPTNTNTVILHTNTYTKTAKEINAKQSKKEKRQKDMSVIRIYAHKTRTHTIITIPEATNTLKGPHRCETEQ